MTHKVLETNSSFYVKKRTTEKVEFQEFSASINKTFIMAGRLRTRLPFYGVQLRSLKFISWDP